MSAAKVGGEPTALAASTETVAVLTGSSLLVSDDGAEMFTAVTDD